MYHQNAYLRDIAPGSDTTGTWSFCTLVLLYSLFFAHFVRSLFQTSQNVVMYCNVGISPMIVFPQSARSGPDCSRWINLFDRPDCRPESPRKSDRYMLKTVADKNRRPVVVLVVWGSGEGRVLTLRRHYARPSAEAIRKLQGRARQWDLHGTLGRPRWPRDDSFW